jgi:hypothetical protein
VTAKEALDRSAGRSVEAPRRKVGSWRWGRVSERTDKDGECEKREERQK